MADEKDNKYKQLENWELKLTTVNIGRDQGEILPVDMNKSELNASGNRAFIENENIRTEYTNDEKGMRQDFIIKNRLNGEGRLKLTINAGTKLKMILGAVALMFKDSKGDLKLKYSSLKCWDANMKPLRAWFEESYMLRVTSYKLQDLNIEKEKNRNLKLETRNCFDIVVNDEDAVYPITIDPLSSVPSWEGQINQANANFGWSVATAGDVNGDGYSDVIVGAPLYDNGHTDEGGVFVYHGSINGLSIAPNWTKEINQGAALFGWSVATAGDVNGDGYSDVIIGSPTYDNGQTDEGRAYIFAGSSTGLSNTAFWAYEPSFTGTNFGYSVACAGDLNNDGYSDIIVGAPFYTNGHNDEGVAVVFKGSSSTLTGVVWTVEGNQTGAHLGFSVSTAGDVNGDGYSDILVGAYKYDNAFTHDGRVNCYYSTSTTYPSTPSWIKNGSQAGEYFGYSVSTAGDVNGDGYSDVIVGAPLYENGSTDEGRALLYYGSSSGLASSHGWYAEGNETGGQLGISVSTAGDVNGDGYADFIAGGNYLENGQANEGKVFLYLGKSTSISTVSVLEYEKNQADSQFGWSVATAGDVNGDGFSDVIIGAYAYNDPSTDEGAVFVYYGSSEGINSTSAWTSEGNQAYCAFGGSVSSAGDVNGDGYADVIIGAKEFDNGHLSEGAAFLFLGSSTGLSTFPAWTGEGNQTSANFGNCVSTAGDVNADGYSDVIVGANYYDNGHTNEGAAFIYLGSAAGLQNTPQEILECDQGGAYFGYSVSTAGDVNGDGFQDVVIGAISYLDWGFPVGAAFVYLGSPIGILSNSRKILKCNETLSSFGESVSEAGDVNGDGYSDVIVGAPNHSSYAGASFVFYGSASGISTTINWSFINSQAGAQHGQDVSSAGDVNGDGYSDVIISEPRHSNGTAIVGSVRIFHGSSTGLPSNPSQSIAASSSTSIEYFISSAGDVDGDGYSDIIVGKILNTIASTQIYRGSTSGINTNPIWSRSGLLSSVSCAGDVNGDGYSDVIIGDDNFSGIQVLEGRAYLYYGGSNLPGLRSNTRQFKSGIFAVISSGMNSGTNGEIRLQQFAKNPFGKGSVRLVLDVQPNGVPFQGSNISNSTSFTTSTNYFNSGITGIEINKDVTSLSINKLYKWRSRVQYSMTSYPFQKFGPWKYYNSYTSEPYGNFRAKVNTATYLNLTMTIQGFYRPDLNTMIPDTVVTFLRNGSSPYDIIDTSSIFFNPAGTASMVFQNAQINTPYYFHLKHRNSIETWSTTQQFTGTLLNYNFTTSASKAFGNNMIQVDASPVRFAIYSGDVNQDGVVDATDAGAIDNDAYNFVEGYVATDLTGEEVVDATDAAIADNNAFNFVAKATP